MELITKFRKFENSYEESILFVYLFIKNLRVKYSQQSNLLLIHELDVKYRYLGIVNNNVDCKS